VTGNVAEDLMPDARKKLIHTVGAIAMAKFVWVNSYDYTGAFKKADNILIRFSTATAASDTEHTPGLSIKVLRDKVPAGTFIAMYALDGHKGLNFFEKPMMNRVAEDPDLSLKLQMLGKKFLLASKRFAGSLGLSEVAEYNEDGSHVDNVKFPWGIAFQPNPDVSNKMKNNMNTDLPVAISRALNGDECLYKIYAVREPRVVPLQYLGYIKLQSKSHPSAFADRQLFFKHTWVTKDFERRPDWDTWFSDSKAKRWETEGIKYYEPYLPAWSTNPC